MRYRLPALLLAAALPASALAKAPDLVGEYALAAGPDVAGGLLIRDDGRFFYGLAAGALDERAEGRWERRGDAVCLFTEPAPVPPAFHKQVPAAKMDGAAPTILVTWPNGRGIAGVDFVIGFDSGDPIMDYTQRDGWTMPEGDTRTPRWVELVEPIYDVTAPRYDLDAADGGRLHVVLTPNDMGVVAFDGACLTADGEEHAILRRGEGGMRFRRVGAD